MPFLPSASSIGFYFRDELTRSTGLEYWNCQPFGATRGLYGIAVGKASIGERYDVQEDDYPGVSDLEEISKPGNVIRLVDSGDYLSLNALRSLSSSEYCRESFVADLVTI